MRSFNLTHLYGIYSRSLVYSSDISIKLGHKYEIHQSPRITKKEKRDFNLQSELFLYQILSNSTSTSDPYKSLFGEYKSV